MLDSDLHLAKTYKYELVIRVKDENNIFRQFIKIKDLGFNQAVFLQRLK
jgi:hypothetical protein